MEPRRYGPESSLGFFKITLRVYKVGETLKRVSHQLILLDLKSSVSRVATSTRESNTSEAEALRQANYFRATLQKLFNEGVIKSKDFEYGRSLAELGSHRFGDSTGQMEKSMDRARLSAINQGGG